jgi:hypothetical protein
VGATKGLAAAQAAPLLLPIGLAAFSIVTMVYLLAGKLVTLAILPIGLWAAYKAMSYTYRHTSTHRRPGSRYEQRFIDLLFVLGVLLWVLINIPFTYQHVFTNRDPATYATAGIWLINHDNLNIPFPASTESLYVPGLVPNSWGFSVSTVAANELYAQGGHLLPALLGLGGRLVGPAGLLHLNVLLSAFGLLAMYAFARLVVKPRWAIAGVTVLALSLPYIYFSRDTYTEPITLAFIFAGLALIRLAERVGNTGLWFMAGLVFGAASLARIDVYLPFAALLLYLVVRLFFARRGDRRSFLRQSVAAGLGLLLTGMLAWIDTSRLSSGYYHDLHKEVMYQLLLIAVVVVGGAIFTSIQWKTRFIRSFSTRQLNLFSKIAWIAVVIFYVMLAVRPLGLVGQKILHNVPHEGFSELSLYWVGWYIGPVLLCAGVAGLAWAVAQLIQGRRKDLLPVTLLVFASGALYFISPHIYPDQVWAARRYLPVVTPGFIVLGVIVLERLYDAKRTRLYGQRLNLEIVSTALISIAVIFPLVLSYPFLLRRHYVPQLSQVESVCKSIRNDDKVVWLGEARFFTMMPTRSVCGNDSFGLSDEVTATPEITQQTLKALANKSSSKTVVIGAFDYQLSLLPATEKANMIKVSSITYSDVEHKISPPRNVVLTDQTIYLGRLDSSGHITAL